MSSFKNTTSATWLLSGRGLLSGLSMLALLMLVGCSSARPELKVTATAETINRPPVAVPLPRPEPVKLLPVKWIIVTPDTMPEGDFVFFALTESGYRALSLNAAETLRWATEASWLLEYYEEALKK
jgi:hypothetical protein